MNLTCFPSFLINIFKILEIYRNNIYTHFCFSKLLILREKSFADFFGPLEYQKKIPKNNEKLPYRRVAQKRYNFAPDATNHTLTHPVYFFSIFQFFSSKF